MIASFCQPALLLHILCMLFIFLLSYHVSADLIVRENSDIEQHITPRLVSHREVFSPSSFIFQLPERSLLRRQNYNCGPGNGYCASNGGCCPASSGCCGASCTDFGGTCCSNGLSCPAGFGCCGDLNIGNEDCVPLDASCCRNGGSCPAGWGCCEEGGYDCAPIDGECCKGYGYCTKGNRCVTYRGRSGCCPGGICGGSSNDGYINSSQPPAMGSSADAPDPGKEQMATAEQTETISGPPAPARSDVPTATEQASLIPTRSVPSIALASITPSSLSLPSVTVPAITRKLEFATTSQSDAPSSVTTTSRNDLSSAITTSSMDLEDTVSNSLNALSNVFKTATANPSNVLLGGEEGQSLSAGTPKIRRARWFMTSIAVFVGTALVVF